MNISNGFQSLQHVPGHSATHPVTQKDAQASAAATQGKQGLPADEAHVSSAASLATQAAAGLDVRMEKVTAIQQALATGSYNVSNSDVAASLINHMLLR